MQPPLYLDPSEAANANKLLTRKTGEEFGHRSMKDVASQRREQVEPSPNSLTNDLAWFVPGLAYALVGVDKSLFELASWEYNKSIQVTTYQADKPLFAFESVDVSKNKWAYIVQGISYDDVELFNGFVQSSMWTKKSIKWRMAAETIRCRDPFEGYIGIELTFILPYTVDRGVKLITEPGLLLSTPMLGMRVTHDQTILRGPT